MSKKYAKQRKSLLPPQQGLWPHETRPRKTIPNILGRAKDSHVHVRLPVGVSADVPFRVTVPSSNSKHVKSQTQGLTFPESVTEATQSHGQSQARSPPCGLHYLIHYFLLQS